MRKPTKSPGSPGGPGGIGGPGGPEGPGGPGGPLGPGGPGKKVLRLHYNMSELSQCFVVDATHLAANSVYGDIFLLT